MSLEGCFVPIDFVEPYRVGVSTVLNHIEPDPGSSLTEPWASSNIALTNSSLCPSLIWMGATITYMLPPEPIIAGNGASVAMVVIAVNLTLVLVVRHLNSGSISSEVHPHSSAYEVVKKSPNLRPVK